MGEVVLAAMMCGFLGGGATEVRHTFENLGTSRVIRIDCETPTHVIEIGLDNTASARDSVHQALFSSYLTGKTPMVVVIDTDGVEDRYQQEIRIVAGMAGIPFGTCKRSFIESWAATSHWRSIGVDKEIDDLPAEVSQKRNCDFTSRSDR